MMSYPTDSPSRILARIAYLPGGEKVVIKIYREHGGPTAVRRLREIQYRVKGGLGLTDQEALIYAIEWTMGEEFIHDKFNSNPGFSGVLRWITAIATGGASEAVRAIPGTDDFMDELDNAWETGWDSFTDAIEDTVKGIKNIDDVGDVMNLVKIVATGGGSLLADSGIDALQAAIAGLLDPYIQKLGELIGEGYSDAKTHVRDKVFKGINSWNTTKTLKKLAKEFFDVLWDIVLGTPMCMCEQGCSKPVTDALKKNGNAYVKLIGQIFEIVYPIVQSFSYKDKYVNDVTELVMLRAAIAKDAGCSGVICSPLEVEEIKAAFGADFIAVTPGIRPLWSLKNIDDQRRILTPEQAIKNGADHIVVGRPIRTADNPAKAAEKVLDEIKMAIS